MSVFALHHSEDYRAMPPEMCQGGGGFTEALCTDQEIAFRLNEIVDKRALSPLYQPIVDIQSGSILAYEGLIRGPSNSTLHAPLQLFRAAALCNRSVEVEHLCRRVTLESFVRLDLPGDLFLNVSPECLLRPEARHGETLDTLRLLSLDPQRVVIELTEQQPAYDYELLRQAVNHYRAMGFRIAIDDLGEGFSSLRLWSELRPEFVKIDMHFIQGCHQDPVKKQFLRSIQEIAVNAGCQVIAEGIETEHELACVHELGIARGQGYFFARPAATPPSVVASEAARHYARRSQVTSLPGRPTAARLLRRISPITSQATVQEVYAMFDQQPELYNLPVVDHGVPLGIISRYALIDRMARPYSRELFGRKPCRILMNDTPLLIDQHTPLQDLGRIIAEADPQHLADGFIIVANGLYQGIGSGQDLMREITQMQLLAARHANALTGLPGNEPLNETMTEWLTAGTAFRAAYFDLDNFKPFNDVYGYSCGDNAIRLLAQALQTQVHPDQDFLGHIGGDDFMVLFCSEDWEERCRRIIDHFAEAVHKLFSAEHLSAGGYVTENRKGKAVFTPLVSLSVGVVPVTSASGFNSYHQVAAAAAIAKKEAKKIPGNSLFIERRAQ